MTENKKDAMSDVNERPQQTATPLDAITADLVAVLVAVTDGYPKIMTIDHAQALPSGPFQFAHRSLQMGLRAWSKRRPVIRSAMSSSSTPSPIVAAPVIPTRRTASRSAISG